MAKDYDEEYMIDYDSHQKILELFGAAKGADHDNRERAREAHLFCDKRDGQWEPYWWNNNAGKPRYTFDMVNPIIDQVAAEIEQSDFDIKVSPAGGDASKDISMTYDGLIRNIEAMSSAINVYSASARNAIVCGIDGWRVVQKYADDDSFDQDLLIEPIGNFVDRVWFDPAAQLQDKSDSRYCFVLHPMAVEEYYARWPEGSGESVSDDREGEAYYDKAEVIVVGELLYVEEEDRTLVQMSNGATYVADDKFEMIKDELEALGITEIRRRDRKISKVCSRMFDNSDWLEDDQDTVFSTIPVIPMFGNYKMFENKTIYWGVVEKLMDPQRVMNYSMSREIEEGALAPRAKYWMTTTQAAGHEDTLATLNTNSDPVQFFNPDPENPGVPQQNGGAVINPGLRTISEAMRNLIGQTAGMFAANMGDNPGLQSGVAIQKLQTRGDNGTIKYFKAMESAIAATGRLLVKAIPKIYDTERTARVLYEDGTFDISTLNERVIDNQTGEVVTINDLSKGQYDVVCRAGPSFRNKQQETIETIIEIAKVDPSMLQISGDVLLNAIPTSAAMQIGERKRAQMLQAGLIPMEQMTDEEQQKMQQAMQSQQGQQQPDAAMVLAQAEMLKAQVEQARMQLEMQKIQNEQMKLQIEAQKLQSQTINDQAQTQIDAFDAETGRMQAEIKAQEAGVKIQKEQVATQGMMIDNQAKVADMMVPSFLRR